MITFEETEVCGWKPTFRGMRNPKNSWHKSDSDFVVIDADDLPMLGENDKKLALSLSSGGSVHAKYRRMLVVYVDITAPLYWWKEMDTYKIGTVSNSCSTMHKLTAKEFERTDFSFDHIDLTEMNFIPLTIGGYTPLTLTVKDFTDITIAMLNIWRDKYLNATDKDYKKHCWWQMIQLLPSSYNQKRTIMMNYEVLNNIIFSREGHKLDEWQGLRNWAKTLPYSELFTEPLYHNTTFDEVVSWAKTNADKLSKENIKKLLDIFKGRNSEICGLYTHSRDLTESELDIYNEWLESEAKDLGLIEGLGDEAK